MESKTRIISSDEMAMQQSYTKSVKALIAGDVKYALVLTYGCQQNEADSERIAGMLCDMGYKITNDKTAADIIIINTCAVREHAELKALSIAGELKHLKENKRSLIIGIGGCMVSQEKRKEDIKQKYPYVDFVFGTSMLYRLPEIICRVMHEKKRRFYLDDSDGNLAEGIPVRRESSFKAWVSIMYGCNNFCSYCIVPYVRGRERSRLPEDILKEVKELAANGYKEITLLGQNVNSYGKDLSIGVDFSDLLQMVCDVDGDFIVRFMTSHPKDCSHKLIDTIAKNRKIARAFHLPLQSGSDRILKIMNRHYTKEDYLELLSYMREKIPDISVTSDIIVGFPGESDEDFEETIDIVKNVGYDNIYTFVYSKRPGTPAATMDNQVPEDKKSERMTRLINTQMEISCEKNKALVGKTLEVIVEGKSKTDDTKLTGRTEGNRLIHFVGGDELIGKKIKLKATDAEAFSLLGEIIK